MVPTIVSPDTLTSDIHLFRDRKVDNDGFFDVMEEELPSILSNIEIHKQTRLELQILLQDMKKQTFIQGITEWTASEQKDFFKKIHSEVLEVGILASTRIRDKIQLLIEDEIWREINDDGKKYSLHDGKGNTLFEAVNKSEYQKFLDTSFISSRETTVIPLDLRLTVNKTDSIESAQEKLDKYHGKYNALILVDEENYPLGIIRSESIREHKKRGHDNLEGVQVLQDIFGYYTMTNEQLKNSMQEAGINILPILDSKTRILMGILTHTLLEKKEVQYYSATSLTELSLDYLKMNTGEVT